MFWTYVFLAFIAGIICNKLFDTLLNLGYSALILKQVHNDSLRIMGLVHQGLAEINHIKILELHRAGKSDKEIEIAEKVSEYHLKSIGDTLVRNFISAFPKPHADILKFSNWDTSMEHLEEIIKEEREKKLKL